MGKSDKLPGLLDSCRDAQVGRGFLSAIAATCIFVTSPADADSYRHLVIDGHVLKWGTPVPGAGAVVTYSLVDSPARFRGARNCPEIVPLDRLLAHTGVEAHAFKQELQAAFLAWSKAANISFVESKPASANILIGAQVQANGRAFTNVEYEDGYSDAKTARLSRSVICLNPTTPWKVGFDGNLGVYDLRRTLIHEIGHAIGLNHPLVTGQIMSFRYSEDQIGLQAGDIAGVISLYGSRVPVLSLETSAQPVQARRSMRPSPTGLGLSN